MFTLWGDFDRTFFHSPFLRRLGVGSDLGRRFERILEESQGNTHRGWSRMNLVDQGDEIVFIAELPGIDEDHIEATVHADVLTVRAERTLAPPEGHRVHRQERGGYSFQRSVSLPVPVDPEQTKANLKDGILRVTLAKAPEHQPRQITVSTE